VDVRVEQGYEIGRPSLLYLRSEDRGEEVDVYVGGRNAMVAKGEFI
jgi:trans-2,3-dihydro-3-hydroxyanthranilate isomerase